MLDVSRRAGAYSALINQLSQQTAWAALPLLFDTFKLKKENILKKYPLLSK